MSLNDELLSLDKKIKYYTLETFQNIPAEPGVYAWFYPLRLQGTDLARLIEEVNFVFNFCHENSESLNSSVNFRMGWRDYFLKTELRKLSDSSALIKDWNKFLEKQSDSDDSLEIIQAKKIIFIASVMMPPLYIGKTVDLHSRCFQHILGNGENNIFHNRFERYVSSNNRISCRGVEELIFACISTKQFGLDDKNYETLFEGILMNLIKPIFSIK
jgi:hypothetical protein